MAINRILACGFTIQIVTVTFSLQRDLTSPANDTEVRSSVVLGTVGGLQ